MNFALVPWDKSELQDKIFCYINPDGSIAPMKRATYQMLQEFVRLGHVLHTYDFYQDWNDVDYFLLWPIDWIIAEKIVKAGFGDRVIYCNAEPPTVCSLHTKEGYEILKQIFPYIMTWNPDWVDGRQIFKKCIPYYFQFSPCDIAFEKRKLITGISANKHSDYLDELYTEREKAYTFFEDNYPDEFDFYGVHWEGTAHPCYRGTVKNKVEVFHKYRFAICFENTKTKKDYITEKIWDCLTAQIVPIYAGAENIREYVPETCFIDFDRFSSYEELAEFLINMSEERYQSYLLAAQKLMISPVLKKFSGEQYAHDILNAVKQKNDFTMTIKGRKMLSSKSRKERWENRRISMILALKKKMHFTK